MLPWATESCRKRHLDRFSRFCTAHGRRSLYSGPPLSPQNFLFALGIWTSAHIIHGSLVPWAHPSPQPQRHLDQFSRFCGAQNRDIQTDRQTTTLSLCDNRPGRIYLVVRRCGLIVLTTEKKSKLQNRLQLLENKSGTYSLIMSPAKYLDALSTMFSANVHRSFQ